MPRFYISDGNQPGRRTPVGDYATASPGVGSDILNEAQAIATGRKTDKTKPQYPMFQFWLVMFDADPMGGAVGLAVNEIELIDWDNVTNRALGVVPVEFGSSDPNGPSIAALVDGNHNSSTSAGSYAQFYAPLAGKYWLWNFGVPRRIRTIKIHAPAYGGYAYAPSSFHVQGGMTAACADFSTGGFYHGAVHESDNTIQS